MTRLLSCGAASAISLLLPLIGRAEVGGARLFPLTSVRLTGDGPFARAVEANRDYLLDLDPDRLLAPFLREAGLRPKAPPYGNWESMGLDGHTAGHYLSALSMMIASGADTPDGKLAKRLDSMLDELEGVQKANGNGYLGGVPGGKAMWKDVANGKINAHGFGLNDKWVPLYNIHKTFAGLRDAYQIAGREKAKSLLVNFGDWAADLVSRLSDEQVQAMLTSEHGGMNEVLADIAAITGDEKYLELAKRFNHHAILDPLIDQRDELTGKHANTQIPKVIGLERIATLTGDARADAGAEFFWQDVVGKRTIAFGGNSVSEHFNDPRDFHGMLEHREGPESCNTYNMLRLTEQLFERHPKAEYADFYERALFNHILSAIDPGHPGYVYFTPLRPAHYRVYSTPEKSFWCCVGSGMENPGKYGKFIYALAPDGLYVNLFIASELKTSPRGLKLRQETKFPFEEKSVLILDPPQPRTFTLHLRHPDWVAEQDFKVTIHGEDARISSEPGSYAAIRREWEAGDRVEVALPMRTRVEELPDGSD
ncbi:glycoside hydrolase family 127 protein [Haloferula sargassicola]|uniref:Glycosyl hydrolase n=1 Tax=Haloferula sargassicola TaxID=490096 RepID=A0ABP9UP66_9BACT